MPQNGPVVIQGQLRIDLDPAGFAVLGQEARLIPAVVQGALDELQEDVAVVLPILLVDVFDEESAEGRFDLEAGDRRPRGVEEGPVAELVHLEDDLLDVLDHGAVLDLAGIQGLLRALAFDAQGNAVGDRAHLLVDLFREGVLGKDRHQPDELVFQDQWIRGIGGHARALDPLLIGDALFIEQLVDQDGFALGQRANLQPDFRQAVQGAVWFPSRTGGRARFKNSFARVEGRDLRQSRIQILGHGPGAAFEDSLQRVAARQRQADLGAKRGQARLFEGGQRGGAFALGGVPDTAFE